MTKKPYEDYLIGQGFQYAGYNQPYDFWEKDGIAIGLCFTCGLVQVGVRVVKSGKNVVIPNFDKKRWTRRSLEELQKFIDERVVAK